MLRVSDPAALAPARAAVERELAAIDRACSRFRADSELSRVNAPRGPLDARQQPLLIDALEVALRAAELTGGDVDPTRRPSLELAGYDRDWRLLDPPGAQPEARARRSQHACAAGGGRSSSTAPSFAIRLPPGVSLDLGATAKAWAADRAAAAAETAGGCGALVSLGGDIATSGSAPRGGWRIRVTDDHRSEPSAPGQTVSISSGALATSSTAVRRWSHAGHTHAPHHRPGAPRRPCAAPGER